MVPGGYRRPAWRWLRLLVIATVVLATVARPDPALGLDPGAVVVKVNNGGGIGVMAGSSGTVIGAPGARNIISGNNGNG